MSTTLVHVDPEGKVYLNEREVAWARYVNNKLFVRPHGDVVYKRASDGAYFFRTSVSYEPWVDVRAELDLATVLSVMGQLAPALTLSGSSVTALVAAADGGSALRVDVSRSGTALQAEIRREG